MTINTQTGISDVMFGDGVNLVFPFDFKIATASEIDVYVDGQLIDETAYTVTLSLDWTGEVTFDTAPVDDAEVVLVSAPAFVQSSEHLRQGPFFPDVVEDDLDKAVLRDISLKRDVDRAFKIPLLDPTSEAGKFPVVLPNGEAGFSTGTGADDGLRTDLASATGAGFVGSRLSVGANLRTQTLAEHVENGPLTLSQFSGASEEAQFLNALTEAATTRDGGQGQTVTITRGEIVTTAAFNLHNRVSVSGANKRGSRIVADSAFTLGATPYMVTANNGGISMFDNALKNLTLDCNHVAGLGGVLSDAWQEGGGAENVLIQNFTTEAMKLRNGHGGAALLTFRNLEMFGSRTSATAAGLLVEQISSVGNFVVGVHGGTAAGNPEIISPPSPAVPIEYGFHFVKDSSNIAVYHFEYAVDGIIIDGPGDHVLMNVTGGPGVTTVVRVASTFTGTLDMIGCRRAGATNLLVDERTNGYGTVSWDARITIEQEPPMGPYPIARGVFNGTVGNFNTNWAKGYASVNRTGTGVYEFTLSRALPSVEMIIPQVTCRGAGLANPNVQRLGVSSFRVTITDTSGAPTDSDEMSVVAFRY